jgi:hypothetical protein
MTKIFPGVSGLCSSSYLFQALCLLSLTQRLLPVEILFPVSVLQESLDSRGSFMRKESCALHRLLSFRLYLTLVFRSDL